MRDRSSPKAPARTVARPYDRRPGATCALVLLLALAACARRPEGPFALSHRFIEQDPEVILEPDDLVQTSSRFRWNLDLPAEAARWSGGEGAPPRAENGIRFGGTGRARMLVRALERPLEAISIQRIEVRANGLGTAPLQLLWARQGERLSSKRSLEARSSPGNPVSFLFDVEESPEWTGQVVELALASPAAPPEGGRARKVLGFERRISETRLNEASRRPWKIDLGGDVRTSVLAPPGTRVAREIRIEPGSRLRFAAGAAPEMSAPIRFRASIERPGGEPRVLSETLLSPGRSPRWKEVDVPIEAEAGGSPTPARIVLEAEAVGALSLGSAIPVFGDPRVVRPARSRDTARVNVVLLSIDTLRADRLSLAGHDRATSPSIDRWAAESAVVFDNAVAQAPWTLPSHVSMLTGLDALRHGVNYRDPAPPALEIVAERFRRAGYATAAFTAGGFVAPQFGLAQGFDRYHGQGDETARRLTDLFDTELERGVERAERWLRHEATRPFFLFFHTYEVHSPYHARQPWFSRFGGDTGELDPQLVASRTLPPDPETLVTRQQLVLRGEGEDADEERPLSDAELEEVDRLYDSGVAFMDDQVGKLLHLLTTLGVADNTVVVLTSDHGEALGEHGLAAHTHLYDETLRVPLIVALPGAKHAGRRIRDQVRSIDVVPTLLEAAELEPARDVDGASLLRLMEGRPEARRRIAWSYGGSSNVGVAVRLANRVKYIRPNAAWPGLLDVREVYDLSRDADERRNLAGVRPDAEQLETLVRDRLRRDLRGIRLHLSNAEEVPLTGTVRGSIVRSSGVTSPDLPCRCVQWQGGNGLRFTVPPGVSYTLVLEHAAEGRLALEGGLEDGPPGGDRLGFDLDLQSLAEPVGYGWKGGAWARLESPEDVPTRLVIEGGAAIRAAGAPEDQPRLLEQLRALGYLD